jgi:small subunit ribosomal protein S7
LARRRRAEQRELPPDSRFNNVELTVFINHIMERGKKTVAERIVYQALDQIQQETHRDPVEVFTLAMRNATPTVEVKARRVGGATYQVPVEVPASRRNSLAMRWLIGAARARTGQPMRLRLAQELMEAARGQGAAIRRREELHRTAEANRAFVHYKW